MSKNLIITEGMRTWTVNGVNKININGYMWVPQDEADKYVKRESLKVLKNGIYKAPKGVLYNKIQVKIKRKDRAKANTSAPIDNSEDEKNYTTRDLALKEERTPQSYLGIQKISTTGEDGNSITWIAEEDASYYVDSETLTIDENGTYFAEEGKLYKKIIVHVTRDEDDNGDGGSGGDSPGGGGSGLNLITKKIRENGTYNASDEGADGYSSVTVDVWQNKFKGYTKQSGEVNYDELPLIMSPDYPFLNTWEYVNINLRVTGTPKGTFGSKNVYENGNYYAGDERKTGYDRALVTVWKYTVYNYTPKDEFVNVVCSLAESKSHVSAQDLKVKINMQSFGEADWYACYFTPSTIEIGSFKSLIPTPFIVNNKGVGVSSDLLYTLVPDDPDKYFKMVKGYQFYGKEGATEWEVRDKTSLNTNNVYSFVHDEVNDRYRFYGINTKKAVA